MAERTPEGWGMVSKSSTPSVRHGMADGSVFFAHARDGMARAMPLLAPEPRVAEEQHCLATLLAIARCNPAEARALAATLLAEYSTLAAVLRAAEQQEGSIRTQPEAVRVLLVVVRESAFRWQRARLGQGNILRQRPALNAYLLALLAREKTEQMRVLFLDAALRLMADEVLGRGTVDHAPVYPREIVRRALALGARSFVLVHNHPSGDATPSTEDLYMTQQIIAAAQIVGVQVADHLIVGKTQVLSMKEGGLL